MKIPGEWNDVSVMTYLKSGMSGYSSYIGIFVVISAKKFQNESKHQFVNCYMKSDVVSVEVGLYRSDMQIKYGEQNGVQQMLCDNEL